jgi:hypothetical protein
LSCIIDRTAEKKKLAAAAREEALLILSVVSDLDPSNLKSRILDLRFRFVQFQNLLPVGVGLLKYIVPLCEEGNTQLIIARAGRALCPYLESLVRIQSVAMRSAGPNCENFVLRVARDQKYLDR